MTEMALATHDLSAGYGLNQAISKLDIEARAGQISAIVGPNGAGKSTLMKVLAGIHRPSSGSVQLFGRDVTNDDARSRVTSGLALCPERRRVFPGMTIEENLLMGAVTSTREAAHDGLTLAYERFPWMKERRRQVAGNLSGGQQQMLAISRALMSSPKLVLLDEPSLGLSPRVVEEVADLVRAINFDSGVSIILVEQNVALGLQLADWVYMLNQGEVVRSGSGAQMRADTDLVSAYLG